MMCQLDRLFAWLRPKPFFYRLTLFTRVLLVAGFLPTGLVKLVGERFTTASTDTPMGLFFEAMYQSGPYWRFIGLCQVVAALLLLVPRLAHLGAMIFVPIVLNIFVITVSLHFTGTPLITGPMLVAAGYLCFWDFHRFRSIFTEKPTSQAVARHRLDPWERAGFTVFALALLGLFAKTRSLMPTGFTLVFLVTGVGAGLLALGRFVWLWRRGRLVQKTAGSS